jgi:hypothetical protein
VEPVIGHIKEDEKLGCNWLKGSIGDKINALLCGAGHNIRIILRKRRKLLHFFVIFILFGREAVEYAAQKHAGHERYNYEPVILTAALCRTCAICFIHTPNAHSDRAVTGQATRLFVDDR